MAIFLAPVNPAPWIGHGLVAICLVAYVVLALGNAQNRRKTALIIALVVTALLAAGTVYAFPVECSWVWWPFCRAI